MPKIKKEQLNSLSAIWTNYNYNALGGDYYNDLPGDFETYSITGSPDGDASLPSRGIITFYPDNYIKLKNNVTGQAILDDLGGYVFGRLTYSGGTYTVTYYSIQEGVEGPASLSGLEAYQISMLFPEVVNFDEIPVNGIIINEVNSPIGGGGGAGPTGDTGPTGPAGDTGPTGPAAVSPDSGVLYVSTLGNDITGDGSFGSPYLTISQALSVSAPATTVMIYPGLYTEDAPIELPDQITLIGMGNNIEITSGVSHTSTSGEGNVNIYIQNINLGTFTLDASLATNSFINLKSCIFSLNRIDGSLTVLFNSTESTVTGGTIQGGYNVFNECLFISSVIFDPYSRGILENCKIIAQIEAQGACVIRMLDCESFGASVFINGTIVDESIPTWEVDYVSDYLGGYSGDVNKYILSNIGAGPTGPTGDTGPAGPTGATGATGATGPAGSGSGSLVEYWVPDPTYWEDTGVDAPVIQTSVRRIGSKLYMFGGSDGPVVNKIYSADYDSSGTTPVFTDTGSTLPGAVMGARIVLLDSTLYCYGGFDNVSNIWAAPVSNPVTGWYDTGTSIPERRDNAPIAVVNDTVMIFGGYDGGTGNITVRSYPVATPTSGATISGSVFSSYIWECGVAVLDDNIYVFGGVNNTQTVYSRNVNYSQQPIARFNGLCSNALSVGGPGSSRGVDLGTEFVQFGITNSTNVLRVRRGNELVSNGWEPIYSILPGYVQYPAHWVGGDGRIYVVAMDKSIYRSGRRKLYAQSSSLPITGNDYAPITGWYSDGSPGVVSTHVLMGMEPWLTNKRTTF